MDAFNPFAKEPQTIKECLEHTAHWLTLIESDELISKQQVENKLWTGRVKKCWVALEQFQKDWNTRDTFPYRWQYGLHGKTFEEEVRFLYKTTKEFYDHLDLYARYVQFFNIARV